MSTDLASGVCDVLPVRFRERWIDDGAQLDLAGDGGHRMRVVVTRMGAHLGARAAVTASRVTALEHAVAVQIDLDTGVLAQELVSPDHPHGASDLAWLRTHLHGDLRAALRQRLDRAVHGEATHGWTDGDRPRVALGKRAAYAELLPLAWDVIATFRGRRYALLDTYRVSREAPTRSVALEIVDLAAGEIVGHAEVKLASTARGGQGAWRCVGEITEALLAELREGEIWYALVDRAEAVARLSRLMATWERDLREPARAVEALLREPLGEPGLAHARVLALGARCVTALHAALHGPSETAAVTAAHALAALGDAAGLGALVSALADPAPQRLDERDLDAIIDAIVDVREHALEPLMGALRAATDVQAQDRLLEALLAIGVIGAGVRDLVIELVRAEPRRASMIGDAFGHDPLVVDRIRELAHAHIARLRAGLGEDDAIGTARELVTALDDMGGAAEELAALREIVDQRRARSMAERAALATARPVRAPAASVALPTRPGRNDPCWCGSARKYKKCHLDADAAVGRRM